MKLTTSDLRIGNWVNFVPDGLIRVQIDWEDLKWLSENPEEFNKSIFGIEITPEILEKCGFEHLEENFYELTLEKNIYGYDINHNQVYLELDDLGEAYIPNKIMYLHELQNIFYSLVGEELKIEL